MTIGNVTDIIEALAPTKYQESYDNAGMQVGCKANELSGILFCLDVTEAVLDEAECLGANMIISHHPLIFKGLKSITGSGYIERVIIKSIQRGISIYAAHTNLDSVIGGVNSMIADKLSMKNCRFLAGNADGLYGSGIIGYLSLPMDELSFVINVKNIFNCESVRYSDIKGRQIKSVALCGGSGSFLIGDAIREKADVFITGEIKYHDFFGNDENILLVDIGHYESEQFTVDLLYNEIKKHYPNCHKTNLKTNPINYL